MFDNTVKEEIYEKEVNIQKIDMNGNVVTESVDVMYLGMNNSSLHTVIEVSKEYLYLEKIDQDYYIFGELSFDPTAFNYPEQYDRNLSADMRYGILKLSRDKSGILIPKKERIISQAIYDAISQNNDKTVIVIHNGDYAYFDYEKGVQLTPVVLKTAVPFSVDYEGFAECSTKDKSGYLPRDVKPITKEDDIKLLTEKQVQLLIKHQKEIDDLYIANKAYEELTKSSYVRRKKYN